MKQTSVVALCSRALGNAWRWSARWFVAAIALDVVAAMLPAAQVLAMRHFSPGLLALAVGASYLVAGLKEHVWTNQRAIQQAEYLSALRRAIARLRPSQIADAETSTKIQSARSAVDYTLNGLAANLVHVAASALTAVSLLLALWSWSPLASVLVVASLIPMIGMYHVMSAIRRGVINQMSALSRRTQFLTDQLVYQRSATELASLGSASRLAEWADEPTRESTRIALRFGWQSMAAETVASLATAGCVAGALAALSASGHGEAALGAGVVAILSGVAATRGTGMALGQIVLAIPLLQAYSAVVDDVPRSDAGVPTSRVGDLAVRQLHVRYPGAEQDAVCDASLDVRKGEMVAIVGANGAGKTTLVQAILGILSAREGIVAGDGVDLASIGETERAGIFGHMTQEFGRYELTVRHVLALAGPAEYADEQMWAALARAKADGFICALPQGLDTHLGQQWDGVGLSGGQWQRLSLARIYLRDAPVWVLDEPTSAVDAESEAAIFADLADHREGHATIVVSHRATTLRRMDRIYVMDGGRIVQVGTYADLAASPGRFAEIFADAGL